MGYLLGLWDLFMATNRIDAFMCRCFISCEVNGIKKNCILLPEFVLSDEIKFSRSLLENAVKFKKYPKNLGNKIY